MPKKLENLDDFSSDAEIPELILPEMTVEEGEKWWEGGLEGEELAAMFVDKPK